MLAVVYVRVSTEDQARHGYSLSGQEDVCTKKAKELGAIDVQIYKDEGISGSILERPGLQGALAKIKNSRAKFFIVYDPDRLSRKLSHQLFISEEVEKAGCRLEFVNFDWEDTPEGRLFYSMRGAIAEYEKEKFLMRSKFGKIAKAQKGLLTHNPGIYGYSYITEASSLAINKEQAPLYRQMVDMALSGASPERIAKDFNEIGLPGPGGGRWYRATVRRILKNPTYTGTLFLNRFNTEGIKTKRAVGEKASPKQRPKQDWIAVPIPSLINLTEWELLQEMLSTNKRGGRGQRVNFYLLSKVIYCGECGSTMYGTTIKGKKQRIYRYYVCSYYHGQEDRKNTEMKCNSGYFQADTLEEIVWNKIKDWLSDPEGLVKDLQSQQQKESHDREKKNLLKHIDVLAKEKERIFTAYRRGILDIDDFEKVMKDIKGKLSTAEGRLIELHKLEESQKQLKQKVNDFKALAREVLGKLDQLHPEDRRHLVNLLINRIIVSKAEVLIIANVPQNI